MRYSLRDSTVGCHKKLSENIDALAGGTFFMLNAEKA
jgi:hypothetical protein